MVRRSQRTWKPVGIRGRPDLPSKTLIMMVLVGSAENALPSMTNHSNNNDPIDLRAILILSRLPRRVSLPVRSCLLRTGVHVVDTWVGLIQCVQRVTHISDPRIGCLRHWILGDDLEVSLLHQVIERLRRFLFIHGVGVDCGTHHAQVFLEHCFPRRFNRSIETRNGKRRQDADDHHDDHQLHQREAGFLFSPAAHLFFYSPTLFIIPPELILSGHVTSKATVAKVLSYLRCKIIHTLTTATSTNRNTLYRQGPCPSTWSTHRKHSVRRMNPTSGHPAWSAIPTRPFLSSDQRGCGEGT